MAPQRESRACPDYVGVSCWRARTTVCSLSHGWGVPEDVQSSKIYQHSTHSTDCTTMVDPNLLLLSVVGTQDSGTTAVVDL